MDIYSPIFNDVLPKCNILEFEKFIHYLDANPQLIDIPKINRLLGESIGYKNNIFISLLNNLIREHKIPTNKEGIMNAVYSSSPIVRNREWLIWVVGEELRKKYINPEDKLWMVYTLLETK